MSFDYYVAVHHADWPTASAFQACMVRKNYPVFLDSAPSTPFAIPTGFLNVRFKRREVALEASLVQLSPTVFYSYSFDRPPDNAVTLRGLGKFEVYKMRPDEKWKGNDINADLARIGAKGVKFGNGDYVLSLSFSSSNDEVRAGSYVIAALINCFGGYGFELQNNAHGANAFADDLVKDAANDRLWK